MWLTAADSIWKLAKGRSLQLLSKSDFLCQLRNRVSTVPQLTKLFISPLSGLGRRFRPYGAHMTLKRRHVIIFLIKILIVCVREI